jgi:hypothetical protein
MPPRSVFLHPDTDHMAIVAFASPVSGMLDIGGGVADIDPTCGDGISWSVDHGTTTIAQATSRTARACHSRTA